jgi:hypothetical protein
MINNRFVHKTFFFIFFKSLHPVLLEKETTHLDFNDYSDALFASDSLVMLRTEMKLDLQESKHSSQVTG